MKLLNLEKYEDAELLDMAIVMLRMCYEVINDQVPNSDFSKKILCMIEEYNCRHNIGCNLCGSENLDEHRAICRECLRSRNED